MFHLDLIKFICFPCYRLFGFTASKVTTLIRPAPVPLAYSEYIREDEGSNLDNPIYIVHGILGSRDNWNTVAKKIAAKTNRKVVTVDLRNHGDSPHTNEFSYTHMALDLRNLMKEHNKLDGKASLVGHSIGGRAAMVLALENPSAIKDLVIVDVSPISLPESMNYVLRLLDALDAVILKPGQTLIEAKRTANEQMKPFIKTEKLRNWLLRNLSLDKKTNDFVWKINVKSVRENFSSLQSFPKYSNNVFDRPCLFVGGKQSNYLKKEEEGDIKKMFTHASFEYVPGATHTLHSEKTAAFLQIICDFLEKNLKSTQ